MRVLLLMRGVPGCGKSTFIKEKGLEPYVLSADALRLLYASPVMDKMGKWCISQRNDKLVWPMLLKALEERMKRGCFTVVDATNIRGRDLSNYKKLAQEYKYRVYVVDFTDLPIAEAKRRNLLREEYKQVPDYVIERMYAQLEDNKVPAGITVIKPDEIGKVWYVPKDLSQYKKIVHIGDIHGCYKPLAEYLEEIDPENYYIFLGDYLDRGSENAQVMELMLKLASMENVTVLEGNHEINLRDYGLADGAGSREFRLQTAEELAKAGLTRKAVYGFYRKLGQCFLYTYHGKKVLATHGGLAKMPENITLVATAEMLYGTGEYEDGLDVDINFAKLAQENEYQVHGHRNYEGVPVQVNEHCFNLDGGVELGGQLRALELTEAGFATVAIGNALEYAPRVKTNKDAVVNNNPQTIHELLESFSGNPYIKERSFGSISSFNFSREAFYNKAWDKVTCRARGLFIDRAQEKIVARSYDKFFNLEERPETRLKALRDNLVFPVQAYVKVNGFLGIVGYDQTKKQMIITSKGDMLGLYSNIFYNTLAQQLKEKMPVLEAFVRDNNCSVIFECIEPFKDPHIIEYDRPHVVLLEIIENDMTFKHRSYDELCALAEQLGVEVKKLAFTLNSWDELYKWLKASMKSDYLYEGKHIEGFVIEDENHFMTKIKLSYYSKWKKLRQVADTTLRHGAIKAKWQLGDEESKEFYEWLREKVYPLRQSDGTYSFATDIIALRNRFFEDKL